MQTLRHTLLLSLSAAFLFAQNPFATNTRIAVGTGPTGLMIADFNGDGKKDIAVANRTSGTISVLLGNGAGAFTNALGSPLAIDPGANDGPTCIAAGDFNGDGKVDIVYIDSRPYTIGSTSGNGPAFTIRLGNGDGTFAPSSGVVGAASSLDRIKALDMNGDGKLDIAGDYRSTLSGFTQGAIYGRVYLGDGIGHFSYGGSGSTEAVDLNGDGKLDYVYTDFGSGRNSLSPLMVTTTTPSGYATRGFTAPSLFGSAPATSQLRVADFDRDGALDVLVLYMGWIQAWRGDGAGGFVSDFLHNPGSGAFSLAVADFDGDGILDWAARTTSTIEIGVRPSARPNGEPCSPEHTHRHWTWRYRSRGFQ